MNPSPTKPADYPGATLLGWQEDSTGGGFWLYNLAADIPGHCAGSTVAESTLRDFNAKAGRFALDASAVR